MGIYKRWIYGNETNYENKDVICKVVNMFYNTFIMFYNDISNIFYYIITNICL